jgi:putative transposase
LRSSKKQLREEKVLELVNEVRELAPRTGGVKVLKAITRELIEQDLAIGRDKFFMLLKGHDLLIKRRKKGTRTTYSNHGYAVAPNRIKDLSVTAKNQVFVSDITYVAVEKRFYYLFLVTDLYSRKIVGYYLSDNLKHEGAINALEMALNDIEDPKGIIHHSDRGCQYCCHEFIKYLHKQGMLSSMTDDNHCYQNAVAERVNGILKDEFYLDSVFCDKRVMQRAIRQAIFVYNNIRLHRSLGLNTPDSVYKSAA